jgi:hypothetical protein
VSLALRRMRRGLEVGSARLQQLSNPPLLILCHPPSQRRGVHGHVLAADFYGCRRLICLIWI